MVAEMGGGPPSPMGSLPLAMPLEAAHPAGTVSLTAPLPPSPTDEVPTEAEPPSAAAKAAAAEEEDAMLVDEPHVQQEHPSRSQSPESIAAAAALKHQPEEQPQPLSEFVPMSELGGGIDTMSQQQQQSAGTSDEEPSQRGDRPGSSHGVSAGYESGDDMDSLNMQHCTNCTGALWGHICMDCGHMPAHDDDIFHPTVASNSALHRPRLQGDALTVICWDERMELHEEGGSSMHPERPDRVRAVMARLQASELAGRCRRLPAREATAAEIQACHIPGLLSAVDVLSEQSRLQGNTTLHFSSDTYVNQHTAMCAKLSAGACVDVASAVMRGEARAGVAVVRPPGHHAESNTAMGFCFFNNAGIAARAAQAAGAERVLVLDWDVHHGNGTQHIFEDDPSVLYMSLHRYDGGSFYPGTGAASEVGEGRGEGYSVNVPWPCGGMRNGDYLAAFQHVILPIAYEYAPDLVIISAGFDAAEGDPIGGCHLTPECYAHMAAQLQLVAPTVALLEGGYNLLSTAKGTEAVVRVLLGERPPPLPAAEQAPCEYGMAAVAQVMRIQARYWDCLRGVVQQQFRLLAAAAARQEQLAAMKLRRQEAAAAAGEELMGAEDEEEDAEEDEGPGMCDGEEGVAAAAKGSRLLGGHGGGPHGHGPPGQAHPHPHRLPPAAAGLDGMEDAETDTPHQQYRGGSGWESDADLASDEEPLSDGDTDSSDLDEQQEQQQQQQQQQEELGAAAAAAPAARAGSAGYGSDASPLRMAVAYPPPKEQQQQPAAAAAAATASDTLPISDSETGTGGNLAGSGAVSDGSTGGGSKVGAAGLTAASPSVVPVAINAVDTPASEQALAASATPATAPQPKLLEKAAAVPASEHEGSPQPETVAGKGAATAATAAAGRWTLSVKPVVLKRSSHQRLSPALVEGEAMQLLQQRQPELEPEHVVPQQEQL